MRAGHLFLVIATVFAISASATLAQGSGTVKEQLAEIGMVAWPKYTMAKRPMYKGRAPSTLLECAQRCVNNPLCASAAVYYRRSYPRGTGQCFNWDADTFEYAYRPHSKYVFLQFIPKEIPGYGLERDSRATAPVIESVNLPNAEACADSCNAEILCQGFSWEVGTKMCYFVGDSNSGTSSEDRVYWYPKLDPATYVPPDYTEYSGRYLKDVTIIDTVTAWTLQSCYVRCDNEPLCVAVNYMKQQKTCELLQQNHKEAGSLVSRRDWGYHMRNVYGCTDADAFNYDSTANMDDGSCEMPILGCTNSSAVNYNSAAHQDDGTCIAAIPGCMDDLAPNYNADANVDDGTCEEYNFGCTDPLALNFDSVATHDDGNCLYEPPTISGGVEIPGCMDSGALNYNSDATVDGELCVFEIGGGQEGEDIDDPFTEGCRWVNGNCVPNESGEGGTIDNRQAYSQGDPHIRTFDGMKNDKHGCRDMNLLSCSGPTGFELVSHFEGPQGTHWKVGPHSLGTFNRRLVFRTNVNGTFTGDTITVALVDDEIYIYHNCADVTSSIPVIEAGSPETALTMPFPGVPFYFVKEGNIFVMTHTSGMRFKLPRFGYGLSVYASLPYTVNLNCEGLFGTLGSANLSDPLREETVFPQCILDDSRFATHPACNPSHPDYVAPVFGGSGSAACPDANARKAAKDCCAAVFGTDLIGTDRFEDCVFDVCVSECSIAEGYRGFTSPDLDLITGLPSQSNIQMVDASLGTRGRPGKSCLHIYKENTYSRGQSGLYYLRGRGQMYCDMETDGGGWTRVLHIDAEMGCPDNWATVVSDNVTLCTRPQRNRKCVSRKMKPLIGKIQEVRMSVTGYQFGETSAFKHRDTRRVIDGLSLHAGKGPIRGMSGVANYAVGRSDRHGLRTARCPCSNYGPQWPTRITGDNWFCESGNMNQETERRWYTESPLWTGTETAHCDAGSSCCSRTPTAATFNLASFRNPQELFIKLCAGEHPRIANVGIEKLELWAREGSPPGVDSDRDGVADSDDNCPTVFNPDQRDTDFDGIGDVCDVCPNLKSNTVNADGTCDCPEFEIDNGNGWCVTDPDAVDAVINVPGPPTGPSFKLRQKGRYLNHYSGGYKSVPLGSCSLCNWHIDDCGNGVHAFRSQYSYYQYLFITIETVGGVAKPREGGCFNEFSRFEWVDGAAHYLATETYLDFNFDTISGQPAYTTSRILEMI